MLRIEDTDDFKHFRRTIGGGTEYVIYNNSPGNDYDLFIFENGARCCPLSRWADGPPTDPHRLYKAQKAFYTIRLDKAQKEFERRQRHMVAIAVECQSVGEDLPFGEEEVDKLKELKALVDRYADEWNAFTKDEQEEEREREREDTMRRGRAVTQAAKVLKQLERL